MSESSMFYKSAIITAPGGGWTQSEINALYTRLGYSSDASPDPYWYNIMLEVAYSTASWTAYTSTVTGGFTPSGTMTKQVSKYFDGVVGFSGSLIKMVGKIIGGILIPTGNPVNSTTSININAPFEEMDCPDSWDDQLVQYFINFNLGTLMPPIATKKRRNWMD